MLVNVFELKRFINILRINVSMTWASYVRQTTQSTCTYCQNSRTLLQASSHPIPVDISIPRWPYSIRTWRVFQTEPIWDASLCTDVWICRLICQRPSPYPARFRLPPLFYPRFSPSTLPQTPLTSRCRWHQQKWRRGDWSAATNKCSYFITEAWSASRFALTRAIYPVPSVSLEGSCPGVSCNY